MIVLLLVFVRNAEYDYGKDRYKLLSVLNLSQASLRVANTAALIILCSTVAACEIWQYGQHYSIIESND
jgi:hypothetical protein